MKGKRRRVLIVEDEEDIAELARDGHEGMRLATAENWSLIVLDLRLPGPDGLEICRAIRKFRPYQPILMLTSKSAELDRVLGLETGADDYLTKPFSVLELVARVRAIFRRVDSVQQLSETHSNTTERVIVGPVAIDPERREVSLVGKAVDLTAREFDLLEHFVRNPGRVFVAPICSTKCGVMATKATSTRLTHTSTGSAPRSNGTPRSLS